MYNNNNNNIKLPHMFCAENITHINTNIFRSENVKKLLEFIEGDMLVYTRREPNREQNIGTRIHDKNTNTTEISSFEYGVHISARSIEGYLNIESFGFSAKWSR